MKLDSLDSSHAIEIPVGHPEEVEEIFDDISYNKGSSVIRMLNNWIGDEVKITKIRRTHFEVFFINRNLNKDFITT